MIPELARSLIRLQDFVTEQESLIPDDHNFVVPDSDRLYDLLEEAPDTTFLGSGSFGMAIQDDATGLVFKVSLNDCRRMGGTLAVDAYIVWMEYCRTHQGEPGVPELHFSGVINFRGQTFPLYVLNEYVSSASEYPCYGYFPESYPDLWDSSGLDATLTNALDWATERGLPIALDLHQDNIMIDNQTGRLIMTDPFHWSSEPEAVYPEELGTADGLFTFIDSDFEWGLAA